MFRTALRNVLAHKARLLMTVLAVMLGVAFVSGTLIFTDTLDRAFTRQAAKSYDDVAVAVTSHPDPRQAGKEPGLSRATLDRISAVPGVASVTGRVEGFAGVPGPDGRLIGVGWSNKGANFAPGKDGKDPRYDFVEGGGPVTAGRIALDRKTAAEGRYEVGDTVRVATNGPVRTYRLQGVFTTDDGAVSAGGSLVLFDTGTAQRLFLKPGHFQEATVTASPGADDDRLLAAIEPLLPEHAGAQTGEELSAQQAEEIEQELSAFGQIFLGFAGIALFVGVFLIANTFTMLVAQRTKEVALMRAVGASRRQITRSVLAEAAIVGVVASVTGYLLGIALAVGLRSGMAAFELKVPDGPVVLGVTPALSALGVGLVVTMLAAWLPGRRAAKIPPVAAMNSVHAAPTQKSLVLRNSIGGVLAAIGSGLIVYGAAEAGETGRYLIAGGAFLALVGVIMLIPLLSRPLIAAVRPLLVGVFGISGKLAGQNSVRNPRRTGATASALAIGLTLVTGLSVIGVTVSRSLDQATTDQITADYLVRMANNGPLDPSVLTSLEKTPGVTAVSPQQASSMELGGEYTSASAVVPGAIEKLLKIEPTAGSLDSLARGEIAVARKTAESRGWKVGSTVAVTYGDGKKGTLTVGALYEDSEFLSPVLVDRKVVAPHEPEPYVPTIFVSMEGGDSAANKKALVQALGNNPAVDFMDHQDIRDAFGGPINMMLNIVYGLLGMALVIAVLGVVNTLAMSVFERQQEIGMLRAIGLDRRRVKRMVRLEAVVISLYGAVVGIVLGSFLGWAIGETIKDSLPGYTLTLPWDRIGLFLLLAGLVGVLAAMWPARSAAKLNVLNAIKAE
ncbi:MULTISPECIES: ABC transporter permease [Streptomyces]|uniref:ABC transporter permease n=1 Tax=Streptomyces sudanensis TaxID=436397 RepID=A0ABY4TBQ4_9ACTN|nr:MULTISPECIES: ABC transporter permease [Streptomyces]URN16384.1 ABC transporter permease [Streptomyces sudanensis]